MIVKGPWKINEAVLALNFGVGAIALFVGIWLADSLGLDEWAGVLVAMLPVIFCSAPILAVSCSMLGLSLARRKIYRVSSED